MAFKDRFLLTESKPPEFIEPKEPLRSLPPSAARAVRADAAIPT
jgi:hypothetical protein